MIGVVLPSWFLARGPAGYGEAASLRRLKRELRVAERQVGIRHRRHPGHEHDRSRISPSTTGSFLTDIARIRRMSPSDALIDIARRSGGQAKVLLHNGGTDRIVETLMRHPASLFMTDAWVEHSGVQNPAALRRVPPASADCAGPEACCPWRRRCGK